MLSTALLLCLASPQAPPLTAATFQRFAVDPSASEVGFDGTSTLHDFTGRTRKVGGELRVHAASPATTAGGSIWADAASLDTDSEGRDENMREHLEVERFPRILFHLDRLEGNLRDWSGTLAATGRFEIHGVARSRTFPVTVEQASGGALRARGELRFKMTDHEIEPPVVAVISVDDEVRVWFDVLLRPVPAQPVRVRAWRVTVTREVQASGGELRRFQESEELYAADSGGLLWVRPAAGSLLQATQAGGPPPRLLDLGSAAELELPDACDAAFAESRKRLASLEEKLAMLPEARRAKLQERMAATLGRLRAAAALAPAVGAARVERTGERVLVRLGEVEWVRLEGLSGEEAFPPLLLGLEGIPGAVRASLGELRGVPSAATVRTVNPAGAQTVRLEFEQTGEAVLPSWFLETDWWQGLREKK